MKVIFLVLVFCTFAFVMDKPAYVLYNEKGKKADYYKMIRRLSKADIVLFGELHNNALVHWLQLQVIKDLKKEQRQLILGAEMFEADDQIIVNEYLKGLIEARHLENEAKIWNNYSTDYKPLLDFAKEQAYTFIATNIPRRYASFVSRAGLDSLENLSEEAQSYIAPLPIEFDVNLSSYQNMLQMMGGHNNSGHGGMKAENMVKAQAIKDATMAHFILQNLEENCTFVHFNGSYHSDNFEGIYWYLKQVKPELDIVTLSSIEQEDINSWNEELDSLANYVISVPADMTKTY
ncbi:putative iron-regulated protein [Catalinimonas alkaloidigena]|uniref:ChaN family lipoprotein n=1 Tax=Catalinimonas alkaloidigena TaxID=1075417 RepID=UPI002404AE99|nr:ChaN family lipoprotein [Catalinimonas alkaloidigena]MDF9800659.1 putative iron-regulated protein [Catalinimonas alkaloidigena]